MYTEEELAGLTDEEREALLEAEDDTTTTMEESLEGAGNGEQDGDGGKGDDKAGADDAGKGAADAGNGGADDAAGADTGADAGATADAGKPAPLLVAEAPADADAKLAAIGEKKNTLIAQFEDGDITAKEYQTELDKLAKEERTIERAVDKAQIAAEMTQQQETNAWLAQAQDFVTNKHPEYSKSQVRHMALDNFVKEIGRNPANASMTGAQILAEAHKRVVEDLGEAPAKKAAADAGKPLKGSQAEPPKTLAKVPAAQGNDVDDGRWALLDRLASTDPEALEEKLMKLSEADRDAYLSRA